MIYLWTGLEVVAVDVVLAVVLLLLARRGLKRSGLGAMLAATKPPAGKPRKTVATGAPR